MWLFYTLFNYITVLLNLHNKPPNLFLMFGRETQLLYHHTSLDLILFRALNDRPDTSNFTFACCCKFLPHSKITQEN